MQTTSEKYKRLQAAGAAAETRLVIGTDGALITKKGDAITFGGVRIRVGGSGPDGGYTPEMVNAIKTTEQAMGDTGPGVGQALAGEIDVDMYAPAGKIPRQAEIRPYVRLENDGEVSEWLPQGVYYLDTREESNPDGLKKLQLHGYDAMLRAEQDFDATTLSWPATDRAVVRAIARIMGVSVDARTWTVMDQHYPVQLPDGYACKELLCSIGAMYAGNFVMSPRGELLLVPLWGLPKETRLLVTETRRAITFGGVRIRV